MGANQGHMTSGTIPLQQQASGQMGLPGDSMENHLGSYTNLSNLGSSTSLNALNITSHLDGTIAKIEPGITTVTGTTGVSTIIKLCC